MAEIREVKVLIPIYQEHLTIVFTDDFNTAYKKYNLDGYDPDVEYDGGVWISDSIHYLMLDGSNMCAGTVAHEAKHIVNNLFSRVGIELDYDNDEAECYLLGWLVDVIYMKWEIVKNKFVPS